MPLLGLLILTHLILPLGFLFWLWHGKEHSKLNWLVKLMVVAFYILHMFLSGRWDMLGYYLRFLLVALFAVAAIMSFVKAKSLTLYPPRKFNDYLNLGVNSLVAVFFLTILSSYVPQGYFVNEESVQLSFPLKNGIYYVGQGGNSSALNYHNTNFAQRYALDIVKLNTFGTRANEFQPRSLTNYNIFEETLYSPCNGTVNATVNNLPDLIPPKSDRQNPAGNHILLQCKGADILMAHLQRGSLTVQAPRSAIRETPLNPIFISMLEKQTRGTRL
jgi:hypothetical protein